MENQNPIQESMNDDSGGSGAAEGEDEGEEEEEDEGVENSPEDFQGELKSKNEASGKAKPNIQK